MVFFKNQWVAGILSGIIGSSIVFFIVNFIFSRQENKLHNQKVSQGNQEMIAIVKPLSVEKSKFNSEFSLKSAISKKYSISINKSDVYSIDDLTSIIIESIKDMPPDYSLSSKHMTTTLAILALLFSFVSFSSIVNENSDMDWITTPIVILVVIATTSMVMAIDIFSDRRRSKRKKRKKD
ncbi:MAG: hypothetical protein LBK56_10815 [Gracilibacteraceae bacterium]|nr:hypothetical protein [Gracilibacteraceae bacterium]